MPSFGKSEPKEFVMDLTEETLGAVCGVIPDAARREDRR